MLPIGCANTVPPRVSFAAPHPCFMPARFHFIAFLLIASALGLRGADVRPTIRNALVFSAARAEALATSVLVSPAVFTDYTNTSGTWAKQNRTTWTSSFVPGLFWLLYGHTGDAQWQTRAAGWTDALRLAASDPDNDQGFQLFCSFGLGYELGGRANADYRGVLLAGASNFDTQRFNPTIGCHRSWRNTSSNPVTNPSITDSTSNPDDPVFEVNIDQMMNLELPLYVGTVEGNAGLVEHAVAHADRTWIEHVRSNGSTFHVVGFNTDGTVQYKRTHQGWRTDSTWSRGQAWAVYGFAMVYRYTGHARMLQRAEACFDYFMGAMAAQASDFVPYSDFDAAVNAQNPRDTAAAAILASAAMDLYRMTGTGKYRVAAENFLLALGGSPYLAEGTSHQAILRSASQKWGDPEVGAIFGDFYFVEAMTRYTSVIGLEDPVTPEPGRLVNISTRGLVGDGDDVLIAGFVVANGPRTLLLRGVGPALAAFGVSNPVVDPRIRLFSQENPLLAIAQNDDWGIPQGGTDADALVSAAASVGAFALTGGSKDAALLVTLPPGAYTLHLTNPDASAAGVGLVEVYEVTAAETP